MWSYCLSSLGITGLWVAARHPCIGWPISIAAQLLWFVYGLATAQHGFWVAAVIYAYLYARHLRKALRGRPGNPQTPDMPPNSEGSPQ